MKVQVPSAPLPVDDAEQWILVWRPYLLELLQEVEKLQLQGDASVKLVETADRLRGIL